MSNKEFFIKLLAEVRGWLEIAIPALIAWHFPQPKYMDRFKKDKSGDDGSQQTNQPS